MNIVTNDLAAPSEFETLPQIHSSKETVAKEMLNAHAILMDISEENRVKFKDVYEYLKEEIKKSSA